MADDPESDAFPDFETETLDEASREGDETAWRDSAITTSITVRPVVGREQEFEAFLDGITGAASRAAGYVTGRIFRPRGNSRDYRIVSRFDSSANLHAWKESDERRAWYAIGEELTEGDDVTFVNITGTTQERPLVLALAPLESFVRTTVSGIGMLLVGTLLALVMANTGLSDFYDRLWDAKLTIGFSSARLCRLNTDPATMGRVNAGRGGVERVRRSTGLGREHRMCWGDALNHIYAPHFDLDSSVVSR